MTRSWLTCDAPDLPLHAFQRGLGKKHPNTLEGGGGGQPPPPDPWATAAATTQTNQNTAAYNKALNLNNFSNPFGAQSSSISGYDPTSGAPIYQTNVTASPDLQNRLAQLMNQTGNADVINQHAANGLFQLSDRYGAFNNGLMGLGNTLSPQAAQQAQQQGQDAAYRSQTQYLDPQFSQQQTSLESRLANQGLTPGSQAYDNAFKLFDLSKNQAYGNAANQSILTGSQIGTQNWQNQLAGGGFQAGLYGQMGQNIGSQGNMLAQMDSIGQRPYQNLASIAGMIPGYSGPGQSGAAPADIGSYVNNAYQGQVAGANARTASNNSLIGAGAGLAGAGMLAYALAPAAFL